MAGRGGWFKSYDDELDDPKIERLNDFEYRVWRYLLAFCNRSPARLRRSGYLLHAQGFPVECRDLATKLGRDPKDVAEAVGRLCRIGASASLILIEPLDGVQTYRVRNWRKRQEGNSRNGDADVPEAGQDGDADVPASRARARARPRACVEDVRRKTYRQRPAAGTAAACPFCKWRSEHPGEEQPVTKATRNQRLHDIATSLIGVCYDVTAEAMGIWKRAAEKHGEQLVTEWWTDFCRTRQANGHKPKFFAGQIRHYVEVEAKRREDPADFRPG